MAGRTLAVPPQPHGPLAQPAGAAVTGPALAAVVERARHEAWRNRARAELTRLRLEPSTPATIESIGVLERLIEADNEAWEARMRRAGGGA